MSTWKTDEEIAQSVVDAWYEHADKDQYMMDTLARLVIEVAIAPARKAGAESMRERAAACCDPWAGMDTDDEPIDPTVMQIQVEIRALPLTEQAEGDSDADV